MYFLNQAKYNHSDGYNRDNYINHCRWLGIRLEVCGSLIVLFTSLIMVYYREQMQGRSGNVGMILTYSLMITMMLNGIVRSNSQIESCLVSVERLVEYIQLPSEVK